MEHRETETPEKIDPRLVQLSRIMATAKTPAEYAKISVRNGADPRYVAHRYLPIAERERFVKACEEWKARQEAKSGGE